MSRVRTYLERLNSGSLPPKVSFSSGEQAADAYSRGFEGAIYDPDHAAEVETAFDYGRGEDAVRAFGIEGSGEGKLVPLYDLVWRVSGSTELFQGKQSQPVGDCFIEGTLVTMADGSQKPIEDIRAGEMVMAPSGKPRKVLSEFSKKYDGPLRSLEFSGIKGTLVCTPDHRILARRLAHTNHQPHAEWVAAESLVVGRGVFQTLSSGYTAVIGNDEVPGFSGTVYCIEVDFEHAFIANGVSVHNCVSRGQTHSAMLSLAAAVYNGEGSWPHMSPSTLAYGMGFHPSPVYWFRGHAGDGSSCGLLALKSKTVGLVLCDQYPSPLDMNLNVYNASTCHAWGRRPPPENVIKELNAHVTLNYSRLTSFEQVRDMIASGFGVQSCGGEGFSSSRDANGVSNRRGHWSHSMAVVGVDDTDWAHKNYNGPLLCILNSWGTSWIKGSRKVHGGDQFPEIPMGAFWARWSDVRNRDYYAISSVKGFPPRKLPDWDMGSLI